MGLGEIRLGEMGLGEMGLGEMGQNHFRSLLATRQMTPP